MSAFGSDPGSSFHQLCVAFDPVETSRLLVILHGNFRYWVDLSGPNGDNRTGHLGT
jgi:hypothetical protein